MSQEEQIAATLSRLNLQTSSSNSPTTFSPSQKRELASLITNTVSALLNPQSEEEEETPVDFSSNIEQSERVPDVVKCLREFSGKDGEFSSWRKSVDRILLMYGRKKDTPKYFAILHTIRHKIVGEADTALESYRTPLNWSKIKKCLMLHYSDKRDVSTLEYQMTTLAQRGNTVEEFYQQVYQYLSLILDKIDCLELGEEALSAMTATYREKALDTFIRGLNGTLPSLLSVREPTSLPQALHMCLKLGNMNYRTIHANNIGRLANNSKPSNPNPPRTSLFKPQTLPFYPELTNTHNQSQRPIAYQHYGQNRNFVTLQPNFRPPLPQQTGTNSPLQYRHYVTSQNYRPPLPPKPPTPMEVDRSLQTRQINYQNRPQYQQNQTSNSKPQGFTNGVANANGHPANKRPPSQSLHTANKVQRIYNAEAIESDPLDCSNDIAEYPEENYEYWQDYQLEQNEEQEEVEAIPSDNINFLD